MIIIRIIIKECKKILISSPKIYVVSKTLEGGLSPQLMADQTTSLV